MKRNMDHKHCKWPLGTEVMTLTPDGYLKGSVSRHVKGYPHACDIDFEQTVDMGDANGRRFGHIIPFRSLKRVGARVPRLKRPWYKEPPYDRAWAKSATSGK